MPDWVPAWVMKGGQPNFISKEERLELPKTHKANMVAFTGMRAESKSTIEKT
jgi:hypothetical protein